MENIAENSNETKIIEHNGRKLCGVFSRNNYKPTLFVGTWLLFMSIVLSIVINFEYMDRQRFGREIIGYEDGGFLGKIPKFGDYIPLKVEEIMFYFVLPIGMFALSLYCIIHGSVSYFRKYEISLVKDNNGNIELRVASGNSIISVINTVAKSDAVLLPSYQKPLLYIQIGNVNKQVLLVSNIPYGINVSLQIHSTVPFAFIIPYITSDYQLLLDMNSFINDNVLFA